mgnify:FL=1
MATVPTQIRIDNDIKAQTSVLFKQLGLDLSSAVNMFLHQCVIQNGIPFSVSMPRYSDNTLAAMEEARKIEDDPRVPSYDSVEDMKKALLK